MISLSNPPQIIPSKCCRWKLHLADWLLFQENAGLHKISSDILSIDELNEIIPVCILDATRIAIPQSSGIVRQNHKVWYTRECKAKKKQNKAWGISHRYPMHENLIDFKKARAKARHIRRSAEKNSWKNYVLSINSSIPSKKMWEQVRKLNSSFSPYTIAFFTPPGMQTNIGEQSDKLAEPFSAVLSSCH